MNDLGADFIRGLKADFKANGAQMLADLRRNEPRHYFNLIRSLSREDIGEDEPQPNRAPNEPQLDQTATYDPHDPYRVVKRSIAMEKLRNELARLQAEGEREAKAAEEELDRRLAEKEAQRDAEARALAAQTSTSLVLGANQN